MRLSPTRTIALALAALLCHAAHAQTQDKPDLPAELKPFVPAGYDPLSVDSADLDNDGVKDYVLVLQKKGDTDEGSRPLLVITKARDGTLRQRARNDKLVYCASCGGVMGDPYQGVEAKPGRFAVSHYGGSASRWAVTYRFAYSRRDSAWQLVRVEEESFHSGDPEKTLKKHVYVPPKDFGKIDLADFDPFKFRGVGPK
jgi:hypothetical protein